MPCQGIPLATKGIIYCPQKVTVDCIKYVLPFNLSLNNAPIKLNLKLLDTVKLYAKLEEKKINLNIPSLKLNQKITTNLKLNLRKCED